MRGNLGSHQQASIAGLGALADLDENRGRVGDHVRHGFDDAIPAKVTAGDLDDEVFEILGSQQAHRHAAFT